MAVTQARTMPGVLELLPLDQVAFQAMLDAVRRNFERFGFLPIETPKRLTSIRTPASSAKIPAIHAGKVSPNRIVRPTRMR